MDLDCQGCEQTFRALRVAVSLGQRLVVTDHAGASATFSLSGSGAALGYDVCKVGETLEWGLYTFVSAFVLSAQLRCARPSEPNFSRVRTLPDSLTFSSDQVR